VFANAGISPMAPLGSITEEEFDSTFNINVKGLLFTAQKAVRYKSNITKKSLPQSASIRNRPLGRVLMRVGD
jgi:NAD(P)-dependent dehydrogenase (short-subunit alcohol dehydrogenase family)